jgi:hypothetical protein
MGTLEEKIDAMLESKRDLADRVVGTGEGWLTELDDDALRRLVLLEPDADILGEDELNGNGHGNGHGNGNGNGHTIGADHAPLPPPPPEAPKAAEDPELLEEESEALVSAPEPAKPTRGRPPGSKGILKKKPKATLRKGVIS